MHLSSDSTSRFLASRAARLFTLCFALAALALLSARVLTMDGVIADLDRLNTSLPAFTLAVVSVPVAVYLALCGAAAVLLVVAARMRDRGAAQAINLTTASAAAIAWGTLQYAFALPMYNLLPYFS